MVLLKNKLFLIASFLFLLNYLLEKGLGIFIPYIHSYLDDLLCMPVILTLTLVILRWFINDIQYLFSFKQIIFAVAYFSITFELVLPQLSERFIADPLDVIAYATGAGLFYAYHEFYKKIKLN